MSLSLFPITILMGLSIGNFTPNLHSQTFNPINENSDKFSRNKNLFIAQQQSKNVSTRGYDFEFTGCQYPSTDELICSFIVVNNQQPRNLQLFTRQSKIIDSEANEFIGALARLGSANGSFDPMMGSMGAMYELPTNVPIKGEVLFRNIPSGTAATNINYVEFNFSQFKIWFTP